MVGCMDDWMHGWVNVCVGWLLAVAWAYGRLSHARGSLPIGLRGFTPRQRPSRSTTNEHTTRTHSTNHDPIVHPFNHTSVHSPIHSFTHPFIQPPLHSSSIRPPIDPLIHPFAHPNYFSSIHPPNQTTLHRSIHPFTQMQPYSISPDRKIIASNHTTGSYRNTINTQKFTEHVMTHLQYKVRNYSIPHFCRTCGDLHKKDRVQS